MGHCLLSAKKGQSKACAQRISKDDEQYILFTPTVGKVLSLVTGRVHVLESSEQIC